MYDRLTEQPDAAPGAGPGLRPERTARRAIHYRVVPA